MARSTVLLLGPSRAAVSGVSTHINLLLESILTRSFRLEHFQVGSEGRGEQRLARFWRLLTSPFLLAVRIFAAQVTLVHLNTSLDVRAYWRDLAYLLVARLCGRPVVWQVHGGKLPLEFARGRLARAWLRATLRLPDAIVLLARCEYDAYRRFVPRQRIFVMPNGIDCRPYAGIERTVQETPEPLRLLYMGRIAREKGLFDAMHGLLLARAQGVRASFTLAGSGPDEASLRQIVERLMLTREVDFAGPVFGRDKLALLAGADILIFPSHAEGLPYAVLEAMAAGVPPITTRVGAMPDIMIDGVHGFFVPRRDPQAICQAIVRLAANRELLAGMGTACRKRVAARYSIERLAGDLGRLYASISVPRPLAEASGAGFYRGETRSQKIV